MNTCKDCLHSKVCRDYWSEQEENLFSESNISCRTFADRSEWVHLPCVAMVEQFIKDGKFDRRKTAHNGRIAVVYIDKKKWNSPLIDITEQFYNTDKAQERIKALEEKQ